MRFGYLGVAVFGLAAAVAMGQETPAARVESKLVAGVNVIRAPWRQSEEIGRTPGARGVEIPAGSEWVVTIAVADFAPARQAYQKQLRAWVAGAGLKAVAMTEAGDADAEALAAVEGLTSVAFIGGRISDKALAAMGKMRGLREVSLTECRQVTAGGVAALAAMPELAALELTDCGVVSNDLVGKLAEFPALRRLALTGDATSPACLPALAKLTQLEAIELNQWRWLADAHVKSIARMAGLKELRLTGSLEIRGPGLAALAGLPGLEAFKADGPGGAGPVRDAWLEQLAGIGTLRLLHLGECLNVTDAGLAHLKRMRGLRELTLAGLNGQLSVGLGGNARKGRAATASGLDAVAGLGELRGLEIIGEEIALDEAWLEKVSHCRSLRRLALPAATRVTDKGLAYLSELTELRELDLGDSLEADEVGAACLGKLTKLRKLRLGAGKVAGEWLTALGGLRELEELDLEGAGELTSPERLGGLDHLRKLALPGDTAFTAEVAAALAKLPALTDLALNTWSPDPVADKAADLKGLQRLRVLEYSNSGEGTPDMLRWAARQGNLQELTVAGTAKLGGKSLEGLGGLTRLRTLSIIARTCDIGTLCRALAAGNSIRSLSIRTEDERPVGGLKELARLTGLRYLWLSENEVAGQEDLKAIATLRELTALTMGTDPEVSEEALAGLAALEHLEELELGAPAATDKVLAALAGLKRLRALDLSEADKVTDAGLKALAGAGGLASLKLSGAPQITDTGLWHLADLKDLRALSLSPCSKINDVGLVHLNGLNLETLRLYEADTITDSGIEALARGSRLVSLELTDCLRITDASLGHLAGMGSLRELTLTRCHKLTAAGVPSLAGAAVLGAVCFDDCDRVTARACEGLRRKAPYLNVAGPDDEKEPAATQPASAPGDD